MKPSFSVSIFFFKIKNKNLWLSLSSPAPHTPWPAPLEARLFPLGRWGGRVGGGEGGSLDGASPAGIEPGFCPLGGRRKVPSWVHVARTNSHSLSHSLANADSEAPTRWCCRRREEGLSRWPGLLSRDLWKLGGWGVREGSLFTSLSIPHSQLCISVCASA